LGWCDVSVLDSVFVGWVLFSLLCFFLWVNCSVFLGFFCCRRVLWVALFLGSSSSFSYYVLFLWFFCPPLLWFCLLFIETHSLPLISPAFAGLYLPRTRSWAGDVVHDWNCCRFSGLRLNWDEEDHTALPLATTTFRPKDTFSLFDL